MQKDQIPARRRTTIMTVISIVVLAFVLTEGSTLVRADGAHPEREIETRFEFSFDVKGDISEFSIWLTFPQPLDTTSAEMNIELHHGRDVWLISESDFPYSHIWTNDSRTLEISSRGVDLSGKDIGIINIRISTPLFLRGGGFLWENYNDIELSFGEQDFRFGLGYGIIGILSGFCLPSLLLVLILVIIEVSLRSFMKKRKIEKRTSTTETLLQLIERSELWMKRRMRYLLVISSLLLVMFAFSFMLAMINVFFAMTVVLLGVLFIFPWLVLIATSIMFFMIRKEDIYWKMKLRDVRKRQIEFMKGLEKE